MKHFENFKKEEGIGGFTEAPKGKSFFSVGKKNQWKTKLNKEQVAKIEYKFRKTMEKFNYKIISWISCVLQLIKSYGNKR